MTAETVHREAFRAWNARDFARMRTMFHPEYTYTGPDGAERRGVESGMSVAQMWASAFPDAKVTLQHVFVADDTAIAECTGRGIHGGHFLGVPPTHREVTLKMCNVIELRDGLIYREREYFDVLSVLTQIGETGLPNRTQRAGMGS